MSGNTTLKYLFGYIVLLCLFVSCSDNKQHLQSSNYDKETLALDRLDDSANVLSQTDPEAALALLHTMKPRAVALHYEMGVANYYKHIAFLYSNFLSNYIMGEQAADSGLRYAEGRPGLVRYTALYGKGLAFLPNIERHDSSIFYFLKALALVKADKAVVIGPKKTAKLYINLGLLSAYQSNYQDSKKYYEQAMTEYGLANDTAGIITALACLGDLCVNNSDSVNALKYITAHRYFAERINDSASILLSMGALGHYYNLVNKPDSAIFFLKKEIDFMASRPFMRDITSVYMTLAWAYYRAGKLDSCRTILAHVQGAEDADARNKYDYAYLLSVLEDHEGHTAAAYKNLKQAYSLQEHNYKLAKDEQLLRHEKELTRLKVENDINEKERKLFKQRVLIWVIIGSAVFLITAIIIYVYNWKKKRLQYAEQQNTKLRQQAFFNQLKPHFIFNALTPLQTHILDENQDEALKYLETFSKLMRGMLDRQQDEFVTLSFKLSFLKSYLDIQQQRNHRSFTYNITVAPHLLEREIWIPSLLLQPIIENAIVHGVKQNKGGHIDISITEKDGQLIMEVEDNGDGLPEHHQLSTNHALSITMERMRFITKEYGVGRLSIANRTDGSGVIAKIHLPLLLHNPASEVNSFVS